MTWTKLDDQLEIRFQKANLSPHAELIHIRALRWCNQALTDGHLQVGSMPTIGRGLTRERVAKSVRELTGNFGWREDGEGGYFIPFEHQRTAKEVLQQRRQDADRQAKRRRKFLDKGDEMLGLEPFDEDPEEDARHGVTPSPSPVQSSPDQSRPDLEQVKGGDGKGQQPGASAALDPDRAGALPASLRSAPEQDRAEDQQPAREADSHQERAQQHADASFPPSQQAADGRTHPPEGDGPETGVPIAQNCAEDHMESDRAVDRSDPADYGMDRIPHVHGSWRDLVLEDILGDDNGEYRECSVLLRLSAPKAADPRGLLRQIGGELSKRGYDVLDRGEGLDIWAPAENVGGNPDGWYPDPDPGVVEDIRIVCVGLSPDDEEAGPELS